MFLEEVLERARARVREARLLRPESSFSISLPEKPFRFRESLRRAEGQGIRLVAEVKRRSPSRGSIHEGAKVSHLARAYERGGAHAISVLTEPHFFGGSLEDLEEAGKASSLPLLRKDFVVDEYQVLEAREAGADAVLLIATALGTNALAKLIGLCQELGMDSLVEVHDRKDLEKALEAGAEMVGINNRDLRTLRVDMSTTEELFPLVPRDRVVVSESGFRGPEDVRRVEELGVDAVLVGEYLMRADDPARAAALLLGGRKDVR